MYLKLIIVLAIVSYEYISDVISVYTTHRMKWRNVRKKSERNYTRLLLQSMKEIMNDDAARAGELYRIKQDNQKTAGYEIGYVMCVMNEKYRKMIDLYNTTLFIRRELYKTELIVYLEELEKNYWDIEHLINMMHEIPRKYKDIGPLSEEYVVPERMSRPPTRKTRSTTKRKKKTSPGDYGYHVRRTKNMIMKIDPYHERTVKKKVFNNRWRIDYGWEPDQYWGFLDHPSPIGYVDVMKRPYYPWP